MMFYGHLFWQTTITSANASFARTSLSLERYAWSTEKCACTQCVITTWRYNFMIVYFWTLIWLIEKKTNSYHECALSHYGWCAIAFYDLWWHCLWIGSCFRNVCSFLSSSFVCLNRYMIDNSVLQTLCGTAIKFTRNILQNQNNQRINQRLVDWYFFRYFQGWLIENMKIRLFITSQQVTWCLQPKQMD